MPVQSRGKWAGRARQMMGRLKHKLAGANYRYRRATTGRRDILKAKPRKIEASLEKGSPGPKSE